jgi:hypothetical protein
MLLFIAKITRRFKYVVIFYKKLRVALNMSLFIKNYEAF